MQKSHKEKTKSDKPIIIVDCHAVGHASKHIYGVLSHSGESTGVIYGFLVQILMLFKKFETTEFIFAWDSKKSFRRILYPPYKISEEEKTEEEIEEYFLATDQFTKLRIDVLPTLGFKNVFIQTGYEADDIIASIVLNNNGNFIVASDDKDLYQLLDRCKMWKLRSKKLYTKENLYKEWNATPKTWAKQKEYSGCKGDKVPNIPGIGDKTAIKHVNGKLKGKKLADILSTDKKFMEKNMKLTCLPYEGINNFEITHETRFRMIDFINLFEYYNFNSFVRGNRLKEWKEFCRDQA